jgi:hypothetical protein
MSRLEILDRDSWRDFLAAPTAVLMLGKTDCPACLAWTEELHVFLADDERWTATRFGKLELDRPGLGAFKKENPWLSALDDLPYTIVYVSGEKKKEFLGSGIDRLVNRLQRVLES